MRTLHVVSGIDPIAGGVATALAGLAQAQAHEGIDVAVVSTWQRSSNEAVADQLRRAGVDVRLIGPALGKLSRHPDLSGMLKSMIAACDIVHIHGLWEEIQHRAAVLAKSHRAPFIFTPHGMLDPWSLNQSRLKKQLYLMWRLRRDLNSASALHFTAGAERDLVRPFGLKPTTIVQPNGIDLAEFQNLPSRGVFRARYPQLNDKFIVLFLGRLHPKKGLELLIPAFAQAKIPNSMLVIAGPDSDGYQAKLQQLAAEQGVASQVIFTGMLYGVGRIEAMVDADLFVLPSYQENFGIAVVEALAAGTPVIVSEQVNIQSEIASAGVGAVVPTQIAPLVSELQRWATDSNLRLAAASKARSFVRERYDWNRIARDWKNHYESIVAAKNRST